MDFDFLLDVCGKFEEDEEERMKKTFFLFDFIKLKPQIFLSKLFQISICLFFLFVWKKILNKLNRFNIFKNKQWFSKKISWRLNKNVDSKKSFCRKIKFFCN